jgi:monomeric sarcosine oxidase
MTNPPPLCSTPYDVAVVGLGAAGSAALRFLALSGASVIGVDRYTPPHAFGSSHGETRLLRVAHAESASYVPMMKRAIELWRQIEAANGTRLFEATGIVYAGPRSGEFIAATHSAAQEHGVPFAEIIGEDRRNLEAVAHLPASWSCALEVPSGFLHAERALETLLNEARLHGATIVTDLECLRIEATDREVRIETPRGTLRASTCILATGAWASELVPYVPGALHAERRTLFWFANPHGRYALSVGFKPFLFETEEGRLLYGFPDLGNGVKIGEHIIGGAVVNADRIDRNVSAAERRSIAEFASPYLPHLGKSVRAATCIYPMSKDGHFVIGRHPARERLILAAGLSGHGFKFAPVIGEAVAALALGGRPAIDLDPFSPARFT